MRYRCFQSVLAVLSSLVVPLFPRAAEAPAGKALAGVRIRELARSERREGGRRLTFIRIQNPDIPARSPAPRPPAPEPTKAELAREAERAAKMWHGVTLLGRAYVGDEATPSVTELRMAWSEDGGAAVAPIRREARVWLPIDLRLVDSVRELETETELYGFTVLLSVARLADLPPSERPPAVARFVVESADSVPGYLFEGDEADEAALAGTLRGLELLLAYERLHRPDLAAALAGREAREAEAARRAAPPLPPLSDQTIYFWKTPR